MNKNKTEKNGLKANIKLTKILLVLTVALITGCIIAFVLVGIADTRRDLLITTTAATTTTKGNNVTLFSIGQTCYYHNQCPETAFCSGTCQCPLHYYFDQNNASCVIRKTNGANCSFEYECNIVLGLRCLSGTCQCEASNFYWNGTFVVIGTIMVGRCQNRKIHGMTCSASEGVNGINYGNPFSSQIRRCWCEQGWDYYHSLLYGRCQRYHKRLNELCYHNTECIYHGYGMCMDNHGDGIKRCVPIPIMNWYHDYQWKLNINSGPCSGNTYKCNEFKNLICRYNSGTGTCQCNDENYYWNNTMCVFGSRYGEPCTTSTQCTPTTAGFTCASPYNGALFTACKCSSTSFYDLSTRICQPLKVLNGTCRDNMECVGSTNDTMLCGRYSGGSPRVCLCTDAYYASGSLCLAKLAFGIGCTSSSQCMTHLNQTCLTSTTGSMWLSKW